jgi:hypothetical protein
MAMRILLFTLLLGSLALAADPAPSTAPAQATVANPVKESDLTTVTLTPDATKRLGIRTEPATRKKVPQLRLYGGEVSLPLEVGHGASTFTALAPPQNATELLRLAELQAAAEGDLSQARVKLEAAKLALDRAETLLKSQTGSERAVEEARAAHQLAQATFEQAAARRALLGPGLAAAPDGKKWWVRVSVPAGDLGELDTEAEATMTAPGSDQHVHSRRVPTAPSTGNSAAVSVDWYYELDDPDRLRRPGERLLVRVPVRSAGEERLTVPWAAVLHDYHGGQWVYEMTSSGAFVRRRVQVALVAGADAALASGPAPGAKIVTDGAAELFGIEFGPGK